jgi:hypothetical protein
MRARVILFFALTVLDTASEPSEAARDEQDTALNDCSYFVEALRWGYY